MESIAAVGTVITALGGLLIGVHKLVKHILDFVERRDARFETFLGNHLSHLTESNRQVALKLEELTAESRRAHDLKEDR